MWTLAVALTCMCMPAYLPPDAHDHRDTDEQRSKLLEAAAKRGEKGFSSIIRKRWITTSRLPRIAGKGSSGESAS